MLFNQKCVYVQELLCGSVLHFLKVFLAMPVIKRLLLRRCREESATVKVDILLVKKRDVLKIQIN